MEIYKNRYLPPGEVDTNIVIDESEYIGDCIGKPRCDITRYATEFHEVVTQYRDSSRLITYLHSFIDTAKEAKFNIEELSLVLSPSCAKGEVLDLIGRIVGLNRPLIRASDKQWFAYDDGGYDIMLAGYGEGAYWDGKAPLIGGLPAYDEEYRVMLIAKIYKNNSSGTHNEIAEIVRMITCRDDILIRAGGSTTEYKPFAYYGQRGEDPPADDPEAKGYDDGIYLGAIQATDKPMEVEIIGTGKPLDTFHQFLFLQIDVLPIPAGVKIVKVH